MVSSSLPYQDLGFSGSGTIREQDDAQCDEREDASGLGHEPEVKRRI